MDVSVHDGGARRFAAASGQAPTSGRWRAARVDAPGDGVRSNFKNFLRTRKIMVMHRNEREECCLRTLVDRKR